MSHALRDYQVEIIRKTRALMKEGKKSILIQSPTGSGKTLLTAHMVKTAADKGMGSWFICHRRELVRQSMKAFDGEGVSYGVIANGFLGDRRKAVQIASIQTLVKRYRYYRKPKLLIWDEAHHLGAKSWEELYKEFPESFHILLTATPLRLDGKGLGNYANAIVSGPSVQWLIENKFLAPYRIYVPSTIDLAGVRSRMGDYVTSELAQAADKPTITGDAIKHYKRYANGKRAVVFCCSVAHSEHVVKQFKEAGIPAEHCDGQTPPEERDEKVRRFAEGSIRVLSNVELFGEGFDLPAIEASILLRPTKSLGLYLQQVGRALRPSPGKDSAIILDHAGNCETHGLPDEEREWSLADGLRKKSGKSDEVSGSVKVCPACFAAQWSGRTTCQFCGHVFETKGREVTEAEGELVEIDPAVFRAQRAKEQWSAQSLEDLVRLGHSRGYRHPERWAHHVFQARQRQKQQPFSERLRKAVEHLK